MKILQLGLVGVLLFCNISSSLAVNSAAANEAVNVHAKDLRQLFDQRYEAAIKAVRDWQADPVNSTKSSRPESQEEVAIWGMGLDVVPFIIDLFKNELASPHWDSLQKEVGLCLCRRACIGLPPKYNFNDYKNDPYRRLEMAWYVKTWEEIASSPKEWLSMMEWRLILTTNAQNATLHKDTIVHLMKSGRLREVLPGIMFQIEHSGDKYIPLVDEVMETKVCGDNPTREQILDWWEENRDKITSETTATPAAK